MRTTSAVRATRSGCPRVLIAKALTGGTVAETWEAGLSLFGSPELLYRHDSERGVAFELPGLTLCVESVEEIALPRRYAYPGLVTDYVERIFGAERGTSLLHRRMRVWPAADGALVDQIDRAVGLLRTQPDSRAAAFSLWRPEEDYDTPFPVSPVSGCFRIIDEEVHLFLVARSLDYWVGAVPELVAFGMLLKEVAEALNRSAASLVYHVWSAHVYEDDCLVHIMDESRT